MDGAGGEGQGAHLGQEWRDEHKEDIIDEQHQQQQCAGLQRGILRGRPGTLHLSPWPWLPHKAQIIPTEMSLSKKV